MIDEFLKVVGATTLIVVGIAVYFYLGLWALWVISQRFPLPYFP